MIIIRFLFKQWHQSGGTILHRFQSPTPICKFLTFHKGFKDESQLIKDKRKHHGAVDKHPLEQQFHKCDVITFPV